jgi:PAS domain S-box-containing protein
MPTPLRVLVIDDSASDAALLLHALERAGYAPATERVCGRDELERVLEQPWQIILCDWRMPGFGGPQALRVLRERGVDAPVIIVSSDLGERDASAAMQGGAKDYVSKQALARLGPAVERELRDAETRRALRASEERFAKAFEYAPIGMSVVGVDGTVLRVNAAMCAMFGYTEAEMMGLKTWQITHADEVAITFAQLQRLLDGEIDTWELERRYIHRDGRILWGRSTTWLVRDARGVGQYVVSQVQDITAQKQLEEQMRRQHAELSRRLRVATFGETVAQVAHEINQPLAAIANFANGLVRGFDAGNVDAATMRHTAHEIVTATGRADAVLQRLRGLLARGEVALERCDANDVLHDAMRLVQPELRAHAITLDLRLADCPLPIEVDRLQVEQVVVNLVQNAVEAIVERHDQTPRDLAIASALRGGREVAVSVSDTGVGLPAADIFAPFFTTKRDGLGLGLSICTSIVQAHGGGVWAEPNARRGATVGFTLPVA